MATRPRLLADGIQAWMGGEENAYTYAASEVVGEFIVRGLLYLRALEDK